MHEQSRDVHDSFNCVVLGTVSNFNLTIVHKNPHASVKNELLFPVNGGICLEYARRVGRVIRVIRKVKYCLGCKVLMVALEARGDYNDSEEEAEE